MQDLDRLQQRTLFSWPSLLEVCRIDKCYCSQEAFNQKTAPGCPGPSLFVDRFRTRDPSCCHAPSRPYLLSTCLLWGWKAEAGIFALAFGALLRIGEAVFATRNCLILPKDLLNLQTFILLRIPEPKTRLRAARHQSAKVEAADLVQLIDMAFQDLPPSSRLWPLSAQTLRRRLDSALERLYIPTSRAHSRPLDLGSFRPGGATLMLQQTEDAELVRRRGRWVSAKVMEIYLQEIAAVTFYPSLPPTVRERVLYFAQAFPAILAQSLSWTQLKIPTTTWFHLWCNKEATCQTGRCG